MAGRTMAAPPDPPDAAPAPPVRRLHYPASPRPRRRWWRWAGVVVLVALAVAGGVEGRRYWPVWKQKRAVMAVERPCLDYAAPPDFVIYTDDPADVQHLVAAADPAYLLDDH